MCNLCKTKPVYEFTNQRKVCKTCFIHWFEKKVFYTIRKFAMIKPGEIIGYEAKKDFRSVVLEEVLKMYNHQGFVELIKLPGKKKTDKVALPTTTDLTSKKIVSEMIGGKAKNLESAKPVDGKFVKPLYLFLDKEVLLYAKLRGLKFSKIQKKDEDKFSKFVDEFEKKHPELKWAVVKGFEEVW